MNRGSVITTVVVIIILIILAWVGYAVFNDSDTEVNTTYTSATSTSTNTPNTSGTTGTSTRPIVTAWNSTDFCAHFPITEVESVLGYRVYKMAGSVKANSCTYYKENGEVAASLTVPYLNANATQTTALFGNMIQQGGTEIPSIGDRAVLLKAEPTTILFTKGKVTGMVSVRTNSISAASQDTTRDLADAIFPYLPR